MSRCNFAEFSEQNFDSTVLNHKGLTVIDFWSESCVPCIQLTKVLKQLAPELPEGVRIGTVKAEENIGLLDKSLKSKLPKLSLIKSLITFCGDLEKSN